MDRRSSREGRHPSKGERKRSFRGNQYSAEKDTTVASTSAGKLKTKNRKVEMPKKFVGENSKAVAARARKAAVKDAENSKKAQEAEDKAWQDNDKQLLKKKQKQEELEKKRQQQLEKKAEAKILLEKELATIKIGGKQPASKITRAEIMTATDKRNQVAMKKKEEDEKPIEENLNRIVLEGETAHGIDEALSILNAKDPEIDRHPEKRMKAAYASFEERMMPIIKEQNPTLRLSQLKQLLKKEWMKSPENPLNQKLLNL